MVGREKIEIDFPLHLRASKMEIGINQKIMDAQRKIDEIEVKMCRYNIGIGNIGISALFFSIGISVIGNLFTLPICRYYNVGNSSPYWQCMANIKHVVCHKMAQLSHITPMHEQVT